MITDTTTLTTSSPAEATALTDFFSAAEARADQWRQLSALARAWQSAAARGRSEDSKFIEVLNLFGDVAPLEAFFAYPGPRLMHAIEQSLADRNPGVAVRLVQQVSGALLTGSYRNEATAWDPLQEEPAAAAELLPPDLQGGNGHRPYFETLVVTPADC